MRFLGLLALLLAASADSLVFNSEQVKILNKAVDEARDLSQIAVKALSVPRSERSATFEFLFGETTFLDHGWETPKKPKQRGKDVTEHSLVYACPSSEESFCKDPHTLAFVLTSGQWDGPTMVLMCPPFFQDQTPIKSVIQGWRDSEEIQPTINAGMTLLHEFQHIPKVTGRSNVCIDVPDPDNSEEACYSPDCCVRLSDDLKIRNAENYNLFAGAVMAWPERAVPPSH
ncbi:hypothetical protein LZ30DRAFT_750981 [Colletotrichum cereale]|nr:hypothetical protein LZ30DRAFT_750981 [Colletotrichum cereale]